MLSDEERKAIESFKEENNNDLSRFDDFNSYTQFKVKRDKIIIDLIEKQQKEIEELKEKNRQSKMRIVQLENEITARIEDVNKYYTPNDKIKAKIEELDYNDIGNFERRCKQEVLQSLLEKE